MSGGRDGAAAAVDDDGGGGCGGNLRNVLCTLCAILRVVTKKLTTRHHRKVLHFAGEF